MYESDEEYSLRLSREILNLKAQIQEKTINKTKGEVRNIETNNEKFNNLMVERTAKGYGLFYESYESNPKLKRLRRSDA